MTEPEQPRVPDSVFQDLEGNQGLTKRWVTDREFREGLLTADDPADFAQQHDFALQPETSAWIKARVEAYGVAQLAGLESPNMIAF